MYLCTLFPCGYFIFSLAVNPKHYPIILAFVHQLQGIPLAQQGFENTRCTELKSLLTREKGI